MAAQQWNHIHLNVPPYCQSWPTTERLYHEIAAHAAKLGGVALASRTFPDVRCPYRLEMERSGSTPPSAAASLTAVHKAELQVMLEEDAKSVLCSECGELYGDHVHPSGKGEPVTVLSRSTGPRKKASDRQPCVHCGGPMHWNDHGAKVNMECLVRQMYVELGIITDPLNDKIPILTASDFVSLGAWIDMKTMAGVPLVYGKMESVAGGASTYSGLRKIAKTLHASGSMPAFNPPAPPVPVSTGGALEELVEAAVAATITEPTPEERVLSDKERQKRRRALLKKVRK